METHTIDSKGALNSIHWTQANTCVCAFVCVLCVCVFVFVFVCVCVCVCVFLTVNLSETMPTVYIVAVLVCGLLAVLYLGVEPKITQQKTTVSLTNIRNLRRKPSSTTLRTKTICSGSSILKGTLSHNY